MYTNIKHADGLVAVKSLFDKHQHPRRPDSHLLKLLEICLNSNDFWVDGKFWLQTKGTAMGKIFAPSYANIFMAFLEEQFFASVGYRPPPSMLDTLTTFSSFGRRVPLRSNTSWRCSTHSTHLLNSLHRCPGKLSTFWTSPSSNHLPVTCCTPRFTSKSQKHIDFCTSILFIHDIPLKGSSKDNLFVSTDFAPSTMIFSRLVGLSSMR